MIAMMNCNPMSRVILFIMIIVSIIVRDNSQGPVDAFAFAWTCNLRQTRSRLLTHITSTSIGRPTGTSARSSSTFTGNYLPTLPALFHSNSKPLTMSNNDDDDDDDRQGNFFDQLDTTSNKSSNNNLDDNDEDDDNNDFLIDEKTFEALIPKINCVNLVGRVGQSPQPRYFDDGKVVLRLSLAVKRKYHPLERLARNIGNSNTNTNNNNNGGSNNNYSKEETDWFDLELWGRDAEYASKYVSKGARIGITGTLKMDSWNDKVSGETKNAYKVVVKHLDILESRAEAQLRSNGGGNSNYNNNNYGNNNNYYRNSSQPPQQQQYPNYYSPNYNNDNNNNNNNNNDSLFDDFDSSPDYYNDGPSSAGSGDFFD